jgi:methyl-accepting chemotaxis protein
MKILSLFKRWQGPVSKHGSPMQSLFVRVDELLSAARELFTESESLKRVVSAEKSAVQTSSSASHEISSMVGTTASAALELSQMAMDSNAAVMSSVDALKVLSELIDLVDASSRSLQHSVKNGLKEIASVTETMAEIREKAKIINDIVFQTKLLSFNASVEAARAGEHGKGFAVVAEEMSKLALESGAAAKEIEEILNTGVDRTQAQIQSVTKELEAVAKQTIEAISEVAQKSTEISTAFSRLESYSKGTESKAREISLATNEQKIGVQEISNSLQALELSSNQLDNMAAASHKRAADLASAVGAITDEFMAFGASVGVMLKRVEKPFDFDSAISAHIDWKMKLSKYLEKPDGTLDHQKVCLDNACVLGKWIYGAGQDFREINPDLFDSVKDSHASFHKTAGHIIQLINSSRSEEAAKELGPSGPYMEISQKTVGLIRDLKAFVDP